MRLVGRPLILSAALTAVLCVAATSTATDEVPPDASALLEGVDAMRLPPGDAEISIRVTAYRNEETDRSSHYKILYGENGDSVVEVMSPARSRGQKILATDQGLWFRAPRSRRPVRITPLQRLMGEASYGDLSRIRFTHDYSAAFDEEAMREALDGVECWRLRLTPKSSAAQYRSVLLWVSVATGAPVRAAFFLASGKHFKSAQFAEPVSRDGKTLVESVAYVDEFHRDRRTLLELERVLERDLPRRVFTRKYLELGD